MFVRVSAGEVCVCGWVWLRVHTLRRTRWQGSENETRWWVDGVRTVNWCRPREEEKAPRLCEGYCSEGVVVLQGEVVVKGGRVGGQRGLR